MFLCIQPLVKWFPILCNTSGRPASEIIVQVHKSEPKEAHKVVKVQLSGSHYSPMMRLCFGDEYNTELIGAITAKVLMDRIKIVDGMTLWVVVKLKGRGDTNEESN